jgi:hypothetical protein
MCLMKKYKIRQGITFIRYKRYKRDLDNRCRTCNTFNNNSCLCDSDRYPPNTIEGFRIQRTCVYINNYLFYFYIFYAKKETYNT